MLCHNTNILKTVECNIEKRLYFRYKPTDSYIVKLSNALVNNTSVTDIYFPNGDWSDICFKSLSETLKKNSSIKKLKICNGNFSEVGAIALGSALKINSTFLVLDLCKMRIGNAAVKTLGEALKENTSLTELNLEDNYIGDEGAKTLGEVLEVNKSLSRLSLRGNQIGDEGATMLSKGLTLNATLEDLHLSRNQVGAIGARMLGESLKVNTSLEFLSLFGNQVNDSGVSALAVALSSNSSLSYLFLDEDELGETGRAGLESIKHKLAKNRVLAKSKKKSTEAKSFIALQSFEYWLFNLNLSAVETKKVYNEVVSKYDSRNYHFLYGRKLNEARITDLESIKQKFLKDNALAERKQNSIEAKKQVFTTHNEVVSALRGLSKVAAFLYGSINKKSHETPMPLNLESKTSVEDLKQLDVKTISEVSSDTFRALAIVPVQTLQAVATVSAESFLLLAKARPKILDDILKMGENKEKVELECEEIQQCKPLQEFYIFFQRGAMSVIGASLAIYSPLQQLRDIRESKPEQLVNWVCDNVELPILKETVRKVLKKIVGFTAERERRTEVNNLTKCFPNPQTSGALIEILARYLALQQKQNILDAARPQQRTKMQAFIHKIKAGVKWLQVDDIETAAQAMGAEQGERLVTHLMEVKATGAVTIKDISKLALIATEGNVDPHFNLTPIVANQNGVPVMAANLNSDQNQVTSGYDPTLFAKATSTAQQAESKASTANSKAEAASQDAMNAQEKADAAKAKADKANSKTDRVNAKIERLQEELSRTTGRFKQFDKMVGEVLFEISPDGSQRQKNTDAVDTLNLGLSRLQARDDKRNEIISSRLFQLEEAVGVLVEENHKLKEMIKPKKSKKNLKLTFWDRVSSSSQSSTVSEKAANPSSSNQQLTKAPHPKIDYRAQLFGNRVSL